MRSSVLVVLLVMVGPGVGCSDRAIVPDAASYDVAMADVATSDGPASDRAVPDARGDASTFCSKNQGIINGSQVPFVSVDAGLPVSNLCLATERTLRVSMKGKWGGSIVDISAFICNGYGGKNFKTHLDLSSHSTVVAVTVAPCGGTSSCSLHSMTNASFAGTIDQNPTGAFPGLQVSICLTADMKPGRPGNVRSLRLSAGMTVRDECVPNVDHTCNHDPSVSALLGSCDPFGRCTCKPGAKKVPTSGKCK